MNNQEAIKILKDTLYDERTPNNYIQAVRMGREALENQKTGHWENDEVDGWFKCSNCGSLSSIDTNYCPNCGQKNGRKKQ